MLSVFFSYSHADEALRDQLETHLAVLKRQGVIATWHDRRILAGHEIDGAIDVNLEIANIVLLLVSPDFLASNYCYDREMLRAMERHETQEAVVIPVILRPSDWHHAPFGKLLATPTDGKPITQWPDRDQAFLEVVKAIRAVAQQPNKTSDSPKSSDRVTLERADFALHGEALDATRAPRSSNLRLAKQFTERDKDEFKHETFAYIAKFFENSLVELRARNEGIEGTFRHVDGNRFTASVYRNGSAIARCTVFMGNSASTGGIAYSNSETNESNSYNECLSVHSNDQMLYLQSMGMAHLRSHDVDKKLSQEGAAEFYWSMLIDRLQRT